MTVLADALRVRSALSAEDFTRAEIVREKTGGRLAATLVRLGLVPEEDIALTLSEALQLPRVSSFRALEDQNQYWQLNPHFLKRHSVFPLDIADDQLRLAMADPEDEEALNAIRFATGLDVSPLVATFSEIEAQLSTLLTNDKHAIGSVGEDYRTGAADDIERLLEDASDAPVIRLVQTLLAGAVSRNASDVHIEPMARHLVIRYRVDGRLIEVERYPDSFAAPIASRIKVLAGLDIAETRLPQDGRMRLTVQGRDVDVRISTSPTAWGESLVLRLLGRTTVPLDLDRLGLPPAALATLTSALARPHGIILLTGPTGSGKTTTLYAAIAKLKRPEVKILTVEDPVEVLMDGINQVQVRPDIGLGYPDTLRAFLRQDPDILMIGEIRDRETADIAMRAALTGHLVLSTLHTNSALGAFTRLADLGIEPYLTASTVITTIAQRLVRALCPTCRQARSIEPTEAALFEACGIDVPEQIHEPVGCDSCHQTGYRARIPLIEIIEVDETIREAIRGGQIDPDQGHGDRAQSLRGHGLSLVTQGLTSLGEIERAVQAV